MMASIGHDLGGKRRILFYDADGSRKSIRLGKIGKREADSVKYRVEQLLTAKLTGVMDRDLSLWVEGCPAGLRPKLVRVGLLGAKLSEQPKEELTKLTLDAFLVDFMERNGPSKKPSTRVVWGQVMRMLRHYMPKGITLNDVTTGHAKEFVNQLKAHGLASTTIHKRVSFARQFFEDALDWELIGKNPFAKVKPKASSAKTNVFVPREVIAQVLKHCDLTWETIVVLSRYGGLRCPSETLSLKWADVDWAGNRMSVIEPKVEHHEGRGIRSVPLFPEVKEVLERVWDAAPEGAVYVVDKQVYRDAAMTSAGWANSNLRTQFLKRLQKAGLSPWPRLFHSMRASRQTELERVHPRTWSVPGWAIRKPWRSEITC